MAADLLPALVVSEGGERYERARSVLATIGFRAVQLPAVFVPSTTKCQGTNGHRLAMRNAWAMIAMANVSMGIFEDDVRLRCLRSLVCVLATQLCPDPVLDRSSCQGRLLSQRC